jgi:rhodanese-related sulfurtransferase
MSVTETVAADGLSSCARPADAVQVLSAERSLWEPLVRFDPETRVHTRAVVSAGWEAWVLTWLPGQGTLIHDHGGSAGAFVVVEGSLTEETYGLRSASDPGVRELGIGRVRAFSARHVHRVTNTGDVPTVSVHVYAPAIRSMTTYDVRRPRWTAHRGRRRAGRSGLVSPLAPPRSIESVLAEARTRLERLEPQEAYQAVAAGALLVDIRPAAQRAADGEVPGALVVERNVLEWRFDPTSEARLPIASYDLFVIVLCQEGYTSSLAAVALQDLGIRQSTDVTGGFAAWCRAGLPIC